MTVLDNDMMPVGDLEWANTLIRVLEEFRAQNPDVTANQILCLLHVLCEPGISQTVLSDKGHLNVASGTVTRLCGILSDRGNRGTPGQGLIAIGNPPGDYRTTAQYLTKKGHGLLGRVRSIMQAK